MKQALFVFMFLMAVLFAVNRQASASSRSYEDVFGYAYTNHENFSRDSDAGVRPGVQMPASQNG